jgi:hypothetical protein
VIEKEPECGSIHGSRHVTCLEVSCGYLEPDYINPWNINCVFTMHCENTTYHWCTSVDCSLQKHIHDIRGMLCFHNAVYISASGVCCVFTMQSTEAHQGHVVFSQGSLQKRIRGNVVLVRTVASPNVNLQHDMHLMAHHLERA